MNSYFLLFPSYSPPIPPPFHYLSKDEASSAN
jgi:hypothetical protein